MFSRLVVAAACLVLCSTGERQRTLDEFVKAGTVSDLQGAAEAARYAQQELMIRDKLRASATTRHGKLPKTKAFDFPPVNISIPYKELDYNVPMSDGTTLYARVLFKDTGARTFHKKATIFTMTPYEGPLQDFCIIGGLQYGAPDFASLVLVESRGRMNSTGTYDLFRDGVSDTADIVKWIASQPWNNGRIIPYGVSAMGIYSYFASATPNVDLTAAYYGIAAHTLREAAYRGGILRDLVIADIIELLPTQELKDNVVKELMSHELYDEWYKIAEISDFSGVQYPTLHQTGWYDIFQQSSIDGFNAIRKATQGHKTLHDSHRLIIGSTGHCGGNLGLVARNQTANAALTYMDSLMRISLLNIFSLTKTKLEKELGMAAYHLLYKRYPKIIWYVLSSSNDYVSGGDEFPETKSTPIYLSSGGRLTADVAQVARGATSSFVFNPTKPMPTAGGVSFNFANYSFVGPDKKKVISDTCGPVDTAVLAKRKDQVTFVGDELAEPLAILGHLSATLEVSSNATDTDFFVTLLDVYPDGRQIFVMDGSVRMRLRGDGTVQHDPLVAGAKYTVDIDMWSICYLFQKGNRLGIRVSSSSSPGYDVNTNDHSQKKKVVANNSVVFGVSQVVLPVVDVDQIKPLPKLMQPPVPPKKH